MAIKPLKNHERNVSSWKQIQQPWISFSNKIIKAEFELVFNEGNGSELISPSMEFFRTDHAGYIQFNLEDGKITEFLTGIFPLSYMEDSELSLKAPAQINEIEFEGRHIEKDHSYIYSCLVPDIWDEEEAWSYNISEAQGSAMSTGTTISAEQVFFDAICSEKLSVTFGFNNQEKRLRFGYVTYEFLGLEHFGEIANDTLDKGYLSRGLLKKGFTVE
jgi:hypothetical protein